MVYHLSAFELDPGSRVTGNAYTFLNIDAEHLRERVVARWDAGSRITWGGQTFDSMRVQRINIYATDEPLNTKALKLDLSSYDDVTNDWITGPAGHRTERAREAIETGPVALSPDPRRVMVVYGRNRRAQVAMFQFLRALSLEPIEWDQAVAETGQGTPHNLDAVRAAMDVAQAVVVVLTAEDQAQVIPDLREDHENDEKHLRGQPRQNVVLEAGMAMGIDRKRVILVQLGSIRPLSDVDGLNAVRLTNTAEQRQKLKGRLGTAGCAVAEVGSDWLSTEAGGDFEQAVITI